MDAQGWNERYSKSELEWGVEPNRFLVQEVADLRPGHALDLGAGEGRNAIWLADRGWTVTAVDFSSVGIDKGRRLAEHRDFQIEWVVNDLQSFEPTPDGYDLVIFFYIHIPKVEWEHALRKAQAALKIGGTLLIVGHDRANLIEGVGGPQDPDILLDSAEVSSLLENLEVEKAQRVRRPVEGSDKDALDTLVRARRGGHGSRPMGEGPIQPGSFLER